MNVPAIVLTQYARVGARAIDAFTRCRVLGLLSFGAIARLIADRARAFGVEVWACDPFVDEAEIRSRGVRPVSFEELVEGADFLVVQAPLAPQTHHTFDRATVRRVKPTAILVNSRPHGPAPGRH